jgi:hypothetical protein
LEELIENRNLDGLYNRHSPDSALTSPASDKSGVREVELYEGCGVMNTSELIG